MYMLFDPNDPSYRWEDNFTSVQHEYINKHLSQCAVCQKRIDDEILDNADFSSMLSEVRKL